MKSILSGPVFLNVFVLFFALTQFACAHERIFDVRAKVEVTREAFLAKLAKSEEVIVGEKHSTASVQDSEAKLFADYARIRAERVTFAWEFWNWSEKAVLDSSFVRFRLGELSGKEFLTAVFGEKHSQATYLPLMEAVKAADAEVLPTNLTRAEKAPVTQSGIGALDPALLPYGFSLGDANYRERFVEAMGGHGDPSKIQNYFEAQCLVDDVVADHFFRDRSTRSAFLVIGNFHSRYFNGVWKRIELRSGVRARTLVEIAESSDEGDWDAVMHHVKYGTSADYVIFAD